MGKLCCFLSLIFSCHLFSVEGGFVVKVKGLNDPSFMFSSPRAAENFETKIGLLFQELGCTDFSAMRDVVIFEFNFDSYDKAAEESSSVGQTMMYSFRRIQATCQKNYNIDLRPSTVTSFSNGINLIDFVLSLDGKSFIFIDLTQKWVPFEIENL